MVPPLRLPWNLDRYGGPPARARPAGGQPTTLLVRVRRYRCIGCRQIWWQDTSSR